MTFFPSKRAFFLLSFLLPSLLPHFLALKLRFPGALPLAPSPPSSPAMSRTGEQNPSHAKQPARGKKKRDVFYWKRWHFYCLLYCAIFFFLLPSSSFILAGNRSEIIFPRGFLFFFLFFSPLFHIHISFLNTLLEKYCLAAGMQAPGEAWIRHGEEEGGAASNKK